MSEQPERSDYPEDWTPEERDAWIAEYNAGKPVELAYAEHDEGECESCDALRALMREADRRDDGEERSSLSPSSETDRRNGTPRGLERRGKQMTAGPWGSLTVTTWGPERTEPELLRASFSFPDTHRHVDDAALQAVIDGAKEWIGGLRLSWSAVACNYLRDGRYHS